MYFRINGIEIGKDITPNNMITFLLETDKGAAEFSEWINEDGVEQVDCNVSINQEDEFAALFDLSDIPAFMPLLDYVPYAEVMDRVDEIYQLMKEVPLKSFGRIMSKEEGEPNG